MENRAINIGVVAEVARALKDFKDQMVFVGGAVISMYTDDPAADEIRPTADIDMTLKVVNSSNYDEILSAHIHPLIIEDRAPIVKKKNKQMVCL